jgi:putative spermidine/putrescine transport system permease protein
VVKRFHQAVVACSPAIIVIVATFLVPIVKLLSGSFGVGDAKEGLTLGYFRDVLTGSQLDHLLVSLRISVSVLAICISIGTPYGWMMSRTRGARRGAMLGILLLPILSSEIVIATGWLIMLGRNGVINDLLAALRITKEPIDMLYTPAALIAGLSALLVPFVALPTSTAFAGIDSNIYRAAASLGAARTRMAVSITLPLIRGALLSGASIVYALCMSAYAIPTILGGGRVFTMPVDIYSKYLVLYDPMVGGALSVILLIAVAVPLALFSRGGTTGTLAGYITKPKGQ